MSVPVTQIPVDDFIQPISASTLERVETARIATSANSSTSQIRAVKSDRSNQVSIPKFARHTLGILLLLVTVVLWTASNFLASSIFADDSYSKPYFVTYVNSSFFSTLLILVAARRMWASGGSIRGAFETQTRPSSYERIVDVEDHTVVKSDEEELAHPANQSISSHLLVDDHLTSSALRDISAEGRLSFRETARLSFEFCLLWFLANYFIAACLEYTTVASSTILTSTSSIWTLFFGALLCVEKFTLRKLIGVLASLAGIILISSVDLTGNNNKNRGSFPRKSHAQLAIGDVLALASALLYGVYATLMKKRIGDEARVDMLLFFGFVGLFNLVTLLPGFFVLHYVGIEKFELPPTKRITMIVLINSATSLVSDLCWAYSMLLTSPLVITVGLSLTIPLSLLGQMILNSQTSSLTYWIGAGVVLLSFVFINYESKAEEEEISPDYSTGGNAGVTGTRQRDHKKFWLWGIWDSISPHIRIGYHGQ